MGGCGVTLSFLLMLLTTLVSGDYSCLCNYNVEKSVFATMDDQGSTVGYMYEFDCKQKLDLTHNQQGWFAVAFEHKIGYVKQDSQIQLQLCPGDPPPEDTVTTLQPQITSKIMYSSNPTTIPAATSTDTQTKVSDQTSKLSSVSSVTSAFKATTSGSPRPTTSGSPRPTTSAVKPSTTPLASVKQSAVPAVTTSVGNTFQCAERVRRFAQTHRGILAQFDNTCYVLIKQLHHWLQAELDCNAAGGHLVHISNQAQQAFLYSFLRNNFDHSVWIGLNDRQSEAHFEWSSGQQVYFVNWANHTHFSDTIEDCVVMDMHIHRGKWDDRDCSFEVYPYICQYGPGGGTVGVTTQILPLNSSLSANQSDGNTQLCPEQVKRNAAIYGTVLGQYERGCYELYMNSKVSWEHAENMCQNNGGHLAHISNPQQQTYIEWFMQRHNPSHAVWLGLHDTITEGTFQWTAGNDVRFINWIPGHHDNTQGGHRSEDCVVFVPQRQGYWDDVHCGYEDVVGDDSGEIHYAFCQYKIHSTVPIVG